MTLDVHPGMLEQWASPEPLSAGWEVLMFKQLPKGIMTSFLWPEDYTIQKDRKAPAASWSTGPLAFPANSCIWLAWHLNPLIFRSSLCVSFPVMLRSSKPYMKEEQWEGTPPLEQNPRHIQHLSWTWDASLWGCWRNAETVCALVSMCFLSSHCVTLRYFSPRLVQQVAAPQKLI